MYRGWGSKAAWKRLRHRMHAQRLQKAHLEAKRAAAAAVRAVEAAAAAKFQSRFKGWLWRIKLRNMKAGALVIQARPRALFQRAHYSRIATGDRSMSVAFHRVPQPQRVP